MAANVMAQVYETLLCSPGMNEAVKIDVKISRKTVLLLNGVIEKGLSGKEGDATGILELIPKESVTELQTFAEECLNKAGLKELSEKIKSLAGKS